MLKGAGDASGAISNESVEKAPEQISSLDVMKNGFVIRSTIEDLLLGYGKMTPEKGVKNIKGTFSTDSTEILKGGSHLSGFISMTLEYFSWTLPHVEGFEGFH